VTLAEQKRSSEQIQELNMMYANTIEKATCIDSSLRAEIAGVDFDLIDVQRVLRSIRHWRGSGRQGLISLVNPHSVLECRRDSEMHNAIRHSTLVLPDGIGIILGAKILSYAHSGRVSGPELLLYICDEGRRYGLTHYFYGGEEGVAQKISENLCCLFPGIHIAGHYFPPFRELNEDEDDEIVEKINATKPTILWLGLGAPKQEKWMARHAGRISAAAMIGVGAAFDFHSGRKAWCPAPLRAAGLEWAYRLAREPRRLWRRNMDSLLFLGRVAGQVLTSFSTVGPRPHDPRVSSSRE
jgi:N-acetylglucosaminyldiphosphoundecaprenol N-acetyl-beta-D-mannosaminyltransferase